LDPFVLLIIVFIVAPLIERMLKAKKGTQPPPEQRPQQRMPHQRMPPQRLPPPQREQEPVSARRAGGEDAAADMLPDDLWEILTGERRPARPPVPQEEPRDERYPVEDYPEEAESLEEAVSFERPAGEWASQAPEETAIVIPPDPYVRPLPRRDVPRVVSLEDLVIDGGKRHERFHHRLDTTRGPARVRRPAPSPYRFTGSADLRRAVIMSEVLGTPKGLE
jgi:hypothetical protein